MTKLCCVDYGFECEFVAETGTDSELVQQFAKHTDEVHGIEYSKEALMQFIMRKSPSTKVEDVHMQVA
jgi:predicted small metal-binding protein